MKKPVARPKQITSQELLDNLLGFIRRKFYQDNPASFFKDRSRLLSWVVLYPATWLNYRAVTVPSTQYQELLEKVLMDTLRFGQATKVTYLPAYLRQVVQTHFQHHGEELYEAAKSTRNMVEHAMLTAGRIAPQPAQDPIRELAQAASLLKQKKPTPARQKPTSQLDLL
jgi:hypothetical protein